MKNKKIFLCFGLLIFCILNVSTRCFAATDIFRAFNAADLSSNASIETVSLATLSFQKLGYINEFGTNTYTTTNSKNTILSYISGTGNNYGFFINCHGDSNKFSPKNGDPAQYIYPSDISGYWHLVFIGACLSAANDSFARAFDTIGYDNRAYLGWFNTIKVGGHREWWGYFYNYVATTNLRDACLLAADKCTYSTPIRMYGDKTWDGKAW